MLDISHIDAARIQTALADFGQQRGRQVCGEHMQRHWRNRSPVTQSYWADYARRLLGAGSYSDEHRLAAALYVACGNYSHDCFWPETLCPAEWAAIASFTNAYYYGPPDKALTRGEWEVATGRTEAYRRNHENDSTPNPTGH